jgi:hypothetical protein
VLGEVLWVILYVMLGRLFSDRVQEMGPLEDFPVRVGLLKTLSRSQTNKKLARAHTSIIAAGKLVTPTAPRTSSILIGRIEVSFSPACLMRLYYKFTTLGEKDKCN